MELLLYQQVLAMRKCRIFTCVGTALSGVILAGGCAAAGFSEPIDGTGCRKYEFADGSQLAIRESKVSRLNAVMSGRPRLLEVVITVPASVSGSISEVPIYPGTAGPSVEDCDALISGKRCKFAIEGYSAEAALKTPSDESLRDLQKISEYLEQDVMACESD